MADQCVCSDCGELCDSEWGDNLCTRCAEAEECSACSQQVDATELDEDGYCDDCVEREIEYQKENDGNT